MIPIWEIWIFVRLKNHKQYDSTELQHISIQPFNNFPFILPLCIHVPYNPFPTCALPVNDSSTGRGEQAFSPLRLGTINSTWMNSHIGELFENEHSFWEFTTPKYCHLATGHGKQSNQNSSNFFIVAPGWMAWRKYLFYFFPNSSFSGVQDNEEEELEYREEELNTYYHHGTSQCDTLSWCCTADVLYLL